MTERHTRQGRARGQLHGTLDQGEPYDPLRDYGSHESANQRDRMGREEPKLRTIAASSASCWCDGTICAYDPATKRWVWPGRDQGLPHPRRPASDQSEGGGSDQSEGPPSGQSEGEHTHE
jgi:hypothetical protein